MSWLHDAKSSNFKFHAVAKQSFKEESVQEDNTKVSGPVRRGDREQAQT